MKELKINCNKCLKSLDPNTDYIVSFVHEHGFGSEFDGETDNVDLCFNCYHKFRDSLMIDPGI